jgi:predicted phosphate transport protein (TIGR00153 family)
MGGDGHGGLSCPAVDRVSEEAMRIRLVPREESFFDLFEQMAQKVHEGADDLLALLENYTDLDKRVGRILDIEHEGDEITHEVIQRLNTTFVTPFDREDIHRLASNLDDVLDHIEAAAEYLQLHRIDEPLPQMISLAQTLLEAAHKTAQAMPKFRKMSGLDEYWVEINRLENEGDRFYRRTIAEVFSGDYRAMDVLRFKDIIEEIENSIDRLEDVANTIESIVLKQG